jgi:hypothetical protein
MNLLGAALYDPGTAASKATSSLLAMTALDTTNLRLTVTVPAHGMIRVKIRCAIAGSATPPSILLGVLVGATVKGRVNPVLTEATETGTTVAYTADADFVITGLSAGATSFDAAYAVQVISASTNIKYGGPNDTSGNDAWGAFVFQLWDPQPIPTAAPGTSTGLIINGTNSGQVTIAGLFINGAAASGGTPASPGLSITGGAASTSSGGTAAAGMAIAGGPGAASTNGAAAGMTVAAGGTTTVSGNDGVQFTATGNGNGITGTHAGSGVDLNTTTSNLGLSNSGIDAILDRTAGVEANITLRQGLRLMLAALAGKLSGAATTSIAVRDTNDTVNRITATVDSTGNRSSVTYNLT